MMQSRADIRTEKASGYLQQLCKHFAHKRPVTYTPADGEITFSSGTCRLRAQDGVLTLEALAEDASHLAEVEDVVARHLVRFAFRESFKVEWTR